MGSFKIGRLVVGLLDDGLRRGMHHARGFGNGKAGCVIIRAFNTAHGSKAVRGGSYIPLQMFHQLGKNVRIMDRKVTAVQEDIKNLTMDIKGLGKRSDERLDWLVFFVVGSVVLEAGFGIYVHERNWVRSNNKE